MKKPKKKIKQPIDGVEIAKAVDTTDDAPFLDILTAEFTIQRPATITMKACMESIFAKVDGTFKITYPKTVSLRNPPKKIDAVIDPVRKNIGEFKIYAYDNQTAFTFELVPQDFHFDKVFKQTAASSWLASPGAVAAGFSFQFDCAILGQVQLISEIFNDVDPSIALQPVRVGHVKMDEPIVLAVQYRGYTGTLLRQRRTWMLLFECKQSSRTLASDVAELLCDFYDTGVCFEDIVVG